METSTPGSKNLGLPKLHPNAIGISGDQPNTQQMDRDIHQTIGP